MATEKSIEMKVVRWAKLAGWLVLKMNPAWNKGVPDRMFLGPGGVTVFIEFKKPGGKVAPLQLYYNEWLKQLGHHAHILDNYDDAVRALESALLPTESDEEDADSAAHGSTA